MVNFFYPMSPLVMHFSWLIWQILVLYCILIFLLFWSNHAIQQLQFTNIFARHLKNRLPVFSFGLGFYSENVEPLWFSIYRKFQQLILRSYLVHDEMIQDNPRLSFSVVLVPFSQKLPWFHFTGLPFLKRIKRIITGKVLFSHCSVYASL